MKKLLPLALSLHSGLLLASPALDAGQRQPLNLHAIGMFMVFVLFTLFVNATSLGLVMRLLGLDKLSRLELALRDVYQVGDVTEIAPPRLLGRESLVHSRT